MSAATILEAENIKKSFFNDGGEVPVIRDFSLTCRRGDFVTVVGPSGCGKSTLLRLFAGFFLPEKGEMRFRDRPIESPDPDRAMMFQEFDQLFPWKNVAGNVEFPLKAGVKRGEVSSRERRERVGEILEEVGLGGYGSLYPHLLSGGMKQRVALARTLVAKPELVLMDEPFGSVDAQKREVLQDLLLSIRRKRPFTIVFVTHDIREAVYLGDRVIVMGDTGEPLRGVVEVEEERPRVRESESLEAISRRIREMLG